MSKLQLGNIGISVPTKEINFYVGTIVDSESGFITPKLITESGDIKTFYGGFPYSCMYERLIDKDGLPVLLIPIITPVSNYNRCSLRLLSSDALVDHCHPRYNNNYERIQLGTIDYKEFKNESEVILETGSSIHLPVLIIDDESHRQIDSWIKYEYIEGKSVVHAKFSEPLTGSIYVEELNFPDLENRIKEISITGDHYEFTAINGSIPDIVVTDPDGIMVEPLITIIGNEVSIDFETPGSYVLSIREVPSQYIGMGILKNLTNEIIHNQGRYPLLTVENEEFGITTSIYASVTYYSPSSSIIELSEFGGKTVAKYRIIDKTERTDEVTSEKIWLRELTYGIIIDFTNIEFSYSANNQQYLYFILMINGVKYAFIKYLSGSSEQLRSDYYDVLVTIQNEDGSEINSIDGVYEFVYDYLKNLMANQVLSSKDECINSINYAFDQIDDDLFITDFDEWKSKFFENVYAKELFISDYKILSELIEDNIDSSDDYETVRATILESIKNSEKLETHKLLLKFYSYSRNLNQYNWDGLKIIDSFNCTQDNICELTEDKKLIDFYLKSKGPSGESASITINKIEGYEYYYSIDIDWLTRHEHYNCYTKYSTDLPDNAINIRDLNKKSEIIEVIVYDYLYKGQYIDQSTIDFISDQSEYNPEMIRYIELPTGTFRFRRTSDELIQYKDWKNTLELLQEYNYHPDLLLVPELQKGYEFNNPDEPGTYNGQISDILSFCKSQYTQALVCVSWKNLQNWEIDTYEKFTNEENRILYFYGSITLDGNQYPTFYPCISHIINNDLYKIPNDLLIADYDLIKIGNAVEYQGQPYLLTDREQGMYSLQSVDGSMITISESPNSITKILDSIRINYWRYNNLYYYQLSFTEKLGLKNFFILQFLQSKISRSFFDWDEGIKTAPRGDHSTMISRIVNRVLSCLPYIRSITYTTEYNNHNLTILITSNTKGLINKVFTVNYLIELS